MHTTNMDLAMISEKDENHLKEERKKN
jgi:hypothetical protein